MEELEVAGLEGWGCGGSGSGGGVEHGGEGAERKAWCLDCVRVGDGGRHVLAVRSVHETDVDYLAGILKSERYNARI